MSQQYEVIHYKENKKDIFDNWLKKLRDLKGKAAILRAVTNLLDGNFGNHKPCRNGIWELIIDVGPGYRVYYSIIGNTVIILLCAGPKKTQNKDIDNAIQYLKKFKEEH